jgi:predicted dienelactone hydrolase
MRILEGLLLIITAAWLALQWASWQTGWALAGIAGLLPALLGLLLVLHFIVDRPRWQMAPLYLVSAALLGWAVSSTSAPLRPAWVSAGLALAAMGGGLAVLLPYPRLPKPGGPYPVGTTVFEWTDAQREEVYPRPEGRPRRCLVQVWYPASPAAGARREPFIRSFHLLMPLIARQIKLPAFLFSHLNLGLSHSYTDAPALAGQERFPVLVFSHGWMGLRVQNLHQMEYLASRGYVVFSVDHAYGGAGVAFSDGMVIPHYHAALPPADMAPAQYDQVARRLGLSWLGDLRFVLDQAERIDRGAISSPLTGRLDLERAGVFGHSTGGGAAIEACFTDPRWKVGLAMDAWLIPYSRQIPVEGLRQPFLFMESQFWPIRRNRPLVDQLYQNMRAPFYRLVLQGAHHDSFTDLLLFVPLVNRQRSGSLLRAPAQVAITRYSLAFFDHFLKGRPAELLDERAQPLPGVQIENSF